MPLPPEKPSHRFFHAFCVYPPVKFETQTATEKVILVLRKHPITQLTWIMNSIIFFILLIVLNGFFPLFFTTIEILFTNFFLLAVIFSYAWLNFIQWFFNVGIVTNERVIDIDFPNLLYKEITATRINKIQEVTTKDAGFLGAFYNYGDVFVETAAEQDNIEFKDVPMPAKAVEIINDLTS